jgi:hypothetical protein
MPAWLRYIPCSGLFGGAVEMAFICVVLALDAELREYERRAMPTPQRLEQR